jgi:uncharacterized protein
MSPRLLRPRKVSDPPLISGMKPYGSKLPPGKPEAVFLQFEEYEAIRLCDFEGLNHYEASLQMDVSRPTLTRIYSRARQKVASALVEGKQIIIEGGKVYFDSEWYACKGCGCYFNHPDKQLPVENCALCGSKDISVCTDDPEGFDELRGCGKKTSQT